MPCCLGACILGLPRLALLLLVIFTDYVGQAYETVWVPLLGFVFLPLTTIAYAWAINAHGEVRGFPAAVVILAAVVDLGALGGSRRQGGKED